MKFEILVGDQKTKHKWWEPFDYDYLKDEKSIKDWAVETIDKFNATLRPLENPREFLGGVRLLGQGTIPHKWTKKNLFTINDHRGVFDNLKCEVCGATARRYGLNSIKMSAKFKAKKWRFCPTPPTPAQKGR